MKALVRIFAGILRAPLVLYEHLACWTIVKVMGVEVRGRWSHTGVPFIRNEGRFVIEDRVRIQSKISSNPIGGDGRAYFVVKKHGELLLKANAHISNSTIVCWKQVTVEEDVYIGGGCRIYDTDFHSLDVQERVYMRPDPGIRTAPVRICRGAFIGAGSIILRGVTVGEGSIVGAGSVVSKSIPDGQVWAGNPARFLRNLQES